MLPPEPRMRKRRFLAKQTLMNAISSSSALGCTSNSAGPPILSCVYGAKGAFIWVKLAKGFKSSGKVGEAMHVLLSCYFKRLHSFGNIAWRESRGYKESGNGDASAGCAARALNKERDAMFQVTREIRFCYGHRLLNYDGKCRHLHGHNGRAVITLEADRLDGLGMVVDFSAIKKAVSAWIDANLDHRMILHKDDPVLPLLQKQNEPFFLMDVN